ncbi:MAG: glycosyltransferase [bacterium]
MKVALVHDFLNQIGGAEKVLQTFHDLYPKAPVYTMTYDKMETKGEFSNLDIKTSFIQKLPGGVKKYKWFIPLMPAAIEHLDLKKYDMILSDCSAFAKGIIPSTESLHICYCHTPTRFLWSDSHKYTEELNVPGIVKRVLPIFLNRLRLWDKAAADRVDHFIANSKFVAERIKKYYQKESDVIYPPVVTTGYPDDNKVEDYYVIVSRLRPYKKVDLVIEAFNALGYKLKIIGTGEEMENLKKLAKPNIEFLGPVADEERNRQLANCRAFINPQEEDFGIAPVEAMAAGRPVVAYKKGGAKETVIEGKTGVFFEDQTPWNLVDVIRENHEKLAKYNIDDIKAHARKFDTKEFNYNIKNYVQTKYDEYLNSKLI